MADTRHDTYTTELEGLRAPLGVILYLIRRDNLDIYDIPIARITKEYLDYLNLMEDMHIELAGEFFVLAATLMRIKVQLLLRRDDDAADDPRDGLVRSLLEYKKMVEAANTFRELETDRIKVYTRRVPETEKSLREDPTIDLSLFQLMKAFQDVMYHFDAPEVREIELEQYTIEEKVEAIEGAFAQTEQVQFTDLFAKSGSRMELIVTLMALLELVKHTHVKIQQDASFGLIWLYKGDNFGKELGEIEEWDQVIEEPHEVVAPVSEDQADDGEQHPVAAETFPSEDILAQGPESETPSNTSETTKDNEQPGQ